MGVRVGRAREKTGLVRVDELREAGDAGPRGEHHAVERQVHIHEARVLGPRPNEPHLAAGHVPELW